MNCEHGVDIDEYDCSDCKKITDDFWECERKKIQDCKNILAKAGYGAEIKNAWKLEDHRN